MRAFTKICSQCLFQGLHGIEGDVYLSLPSVLGENGITHIVKQKLKPEETKQLQKSAQALVEVQNSLKL